MFSMFIKSGYTTYTPVPSCILPLTGSRRWRRELLSWNYQLDSYAVSLQSTARNIGAVHTRANYVPPICLSINNTDDRYPLADTCDYVETQILFAPTSKREKRLYSIRIHHQSCQHRHLRGTPRSNHRSMVSSARSL